MNTKERILNIVQNKFDDQEWYDKSEWRTIIEEMDFYFQKGKDAYDDFINHKISKPQLEHALNEIKEIQDMDDIRSRLEELGFDKKFEQKIETLVAYLDEKARNKKKWNEYKPPRTVSRSGVYQPYWTKQLIKFSIYKDINELKGSIRNSINYINYPKNNISITSLKQRKLISEKVLGTEFNNETFYKDIKQLFADYVGKVRNPKNVSVLCGYMLWEKESKKLWDNKSSSSELNNQLSVTSKRDINMKKQPLNQILYGPPGTGKTYETKELAVNIITGEDAKTRKEMNEIYNRLVQEGRIEFITFHQSYGYEEFVEGIKPTLSNGEESENSNNEDISYEIKDGIFKKLCARAELASTPNFINDYKPTDFESSMVWKIDLGPGGKHVEDCLKYKRICIGWGHIKELDKKSGEELLRDSDALYRFYRAMNPDNNDLVIVRSGSFRHIIAAGIIGEYKFDESLGEYCHTREVNWIWKKGKNEEMIDIYDINNNNKFNRRHVVHRTKIKPYDLFQKIISDKNKKVNKSNNKINGDNKQNYVLIIDEINRGNISKILGELITLVEKDKRLDNKEQLKITLPYSGERFGVPNNLYIIGTMNTADRSIAFLDTALRRRFAFNKKDPQPEILENVGGINLSKMLSTMNNKICKELDKGHRIGHSYFINVNNIEELAEVFRVSICPLLEEYFNEDGARISKVIGDQFLDMNNEEDHSWEWKVDAFSKVENYKKIYNSKDKKSS